MIEFWCLFSAWVFYCLWRFFYDCSWLSFDCLWWLFFMIVPDWVIDCLWWLFLIEFWLSLMIVFFYDFFIEFLIIYDDCVWELLWLFLMIVFEGYVYYSLLLINFFISFDCFIVDMYFCGCKIVCFNAFWYHLTLIHCNKWFSPLCSWFVFDVDKGGEINKR